MLALIYEFLEEQPFPHDFANVAYDASAFDTQLGLSGLHRIRPRVEPQNRRSVLPPELFERYSGMCFWRDLAGSASHVIAASQERRSETPPAAAASEENVIGKPLVPDAAQQRSTHIAP